MPDTAPLAIKLTLPGGDGATGHCRLLGLVGSEALGRLYEYRIRFASDKPDIDALKLLGETAGVTMESGADGSRHFHGHVVAFEHRGAVELPPIPGLDTVTQYQYAITLRPWLWFLTRASDCRVFQEEAVPAIVGHILDKYPGKVKRQLGDAHKPWVFCVQYRETDFNFVSRLLEQEGITYRFGHAAGSHTLELMDLPGGTLKTKHKLPLVPGARASRMEQECVWSWRAAHHVQPGAYVIKDYDFTKPGAAQMSVVKRPASHAQARHEIYDYPGEFDAPDEGDGYVKLRLDELQAQHEVYEGECNLRALAVGDVLELNNAQQAGAAAGVPFMVAETSIDLQSGLEHGGSPGFLCSFRAVRAKLPYRTPRATPKPHVQGPQTAVVMGPGGEEIHTDEHGRIKVKFHWDRHSKDDKQSSCWIRVSQPWAGKNFGAIALPRIGQEVIVDFLEGDPDRPIVTGRVYNADNMPPWALPANKTQSGVLTRSTKGGSAANANALRFEDKKGSEQVWLHAEKDQLIEVEHDEDHWVGNDRRKVIDNDETTHVKHDRTETVDHDEKISIGNDRSEDVKKNETISIGENRSETVGKNETISVDGSRSRSVGKSEDISITDNRSMNVGKNESNSIGKSRDETVGDNETVEVGKERKHTVGKNDKLQVGEGRETQVSKDDKLQVGKKWYVEAGDEITLKTGDASLTMKKDGTIQLKGKDITIVGSGKVGLKASSDMVIKGSKVAIN